MAAIKNLLTLILLVVSGQNVLLQDNKMLSVREFEKVYSYRLSTQVVPTHYEIQLIPHIMENNFTFNGEASIDIEVREPTNAIALHTKQLTIDESQTRLTRRGEDDIYALSNYVPKQHEHNTLTKILTVQFEETLEPGSYTLYFKFIGVISNDGHGFYKSFYVRNKGHEEDKVWLAITHFQPISARQAFPCWDEPAIKATFKFSIKHYPNYTALSNMPFTRSKIDETDGKVWSYFETTPIMSTNVLGFVITDYDYVSNLDGTIKIWAPKHLLPFAAFPLDIAEKAMRELEKFTNSTVHVPKMDHVTAPYYTSRATENWGMIVYKENVLLDDENTQDMVNFLLPIDKKLYNTMTITHELAHQWFGNLVSPAWWNYLWLSEGLSTYLKYYITDKIFKEWRLINLFVLKELQYVFNIDFYEFNVPININITLNVYEAYSSNTYSKSAILFRMISHFLSEDVFRNGLIRYLQTHEYSSVTPDDLWKALQNALDESNVPHNDFKVKEIMDTWLEQTGYPIVTITRDYTTGEIKATQKVAVLQEIDEFRRNSAAWWIPLNLATQNDLDFSSTLATHWLRPQDDSITIEGVDINDWIIINKQQTGYYRVNYDTTNWKRIAIFLNSDNYAKISVLNRVQIINDAFFMVKTKQLDSIIFLEIINYLSREVDPVPWQSAFQIIDTINSYLLVPEGAILKSYILNLMNKLIEHIGFDEHPDDDPFTIKIRYILGYYACGYGHPECQTKATNKLLAYVEDPIANKITANQDWVFCFGLMKANESVWDQLLQMQEKPSELILNYFGCTEDLNIIKKHFDFITTTNNSFSWKYNYYRRIFKNILRNLSNVHLATDVFITNFDKFEVVSDFNIIKDSIMEEQMEKMKTFCKQHGFCISQLVQREQELAKIKDDLSKIRDALENNEFSVTMHMTLNNNISKLS